MQFTIDSEKVQQWRNGQIASLRDIPLRCPHCIDGVVQSVEGRCSDCQRRPCPLPAGRKACIAGCIFLILLFLAVPIICYKDLGQFYLAFGKIGIVGAAFAIILMVKALIKEAIKLHLSGLDNVSLCRVADQYLTVHNNYDQSGRWYAQALASGCGIAERTVISADIRRFFAKAEPLIKPTLRQALKNLLFLDAFTEVATGNIRSSEHGILLSEHASDDTFMLVLANSLVQMGNGESGNTFLSWVADSLQAKAPRFATILNRREVSPV